MAFEFDIVNAQGSSLDADGFETTPHDADGEQGSPPNESHHMLGFWSRPLPAVTTKDGEVDAAQSANLLLATEGGRTHAWSLEDPRLITTLPNVLPGEALVYSGFGSFFRLHTDGAASIGTTDKGGDPTGSTVAYRVEPTGHRESGPWGKREFDKRGFRVRTHAGARLVLGVATGVVPGLKTQATLEAHLISIVGNTTIGPDGAPAGAVVKADALIPALTALSVALAGVQTALVNLGGGGASSGPVVAAEAALAAAIALLPTITAIA